MIGRPSGKAALLAAAVAVVVAVVGAAVWVMESPAEERQRRLDQRRLEDLEEVRSAVDVYWTREGALPPDLEVLAEGYGLTGPPRDPVTEVPYPYRPTGETTYELCATFTSPQPNPDDDRPWMRDDFWNHPAGEYCFTLEASKVTP